MARIRTIKPEFPQSESLGRVSRDARLLFINLWTIVDDEGRTRGASRLLAGLLFPYDADAPGLIDRWLDELEGVGAIRRYVVDGSAYVDIPNWLKHQKIDRPSESRLPEFCESSRALANPREPSSTDLGPRTLDLGPGKSVSLAPSVDDAKPSVPSDTSPAVLEFPTVGKGGSRWVLTQRQVDEWSVLYPGVSVIAEARKALAWCVANPGRRKTVAGMPKFLVGWLGRVQDSHGSNSRAGFVPAAQPDYSSFDWHEECARLHNNRCTNITFHEAMKERAS